MSPRKFLVCAIDSSLWYSASYSLMGMDYTETTLIIKQ